MNSFKDIIEVLKDILSSEIGEKAVLDKHVAMAMFLTPSALACAKHRDIIPFESLAIFCCKKRLALNTLLFSQSVESLIEPTNEMVLNRYHLSS